MAIYKPLDMQPSLNYTDVTNVGSDGVRLWLSCLIDTNNVNVDAYSIVILDGNNNVIFKPEGGKIGEISTLVSDLRTYCNSIQAYKPYLSQYGSNVNTGINGSYLVIPFSLSQKSESTVGRNQTNDPNLLSNNNTYKWIITLYQGISEDSGGIKDAPDRLYYDMTITNGVIVGSNANRIQTVLSDKIYKDYYVQLYHATWGDNQQSDSNNIESWLYGSNVNLEPIGARVPIKSYDSVYGHIYPVENKLNMTDANVYQIYKLTNDPDDLTTYNKVDMFISVNIPWEWVKLGDQEYGKTEIYAETSMEVDGTFPIVSDYSIWVKNGSRVILNNQTNGTDDFDGDGKSNHNGIYVPDVKEVYMNDSDQYKITIQWNRAPDANTWGNISEKVVYISGAGSDPYMQSSFVGQNVQPQYEKWNSDDPSSYPVINKTKLKFVLEKPIDLYTYPDTYTNDRKNDTGLIFFTKRNQLYIRPSTNIVSGMKLINSDTGSSFNIDNLNTEYWYVKPDTDVIIEEYIVDKTRYQIKTFFRQSDESVFYTEKKPTITITLTDISGDVTFDDENITTRDFSAHATYSQENLHQWRSYRWTMLSASGETVYSGNEKYSGRIEENFYGMVAGQNYTIVLTVELPDGSIITEQKRIKADFEDQQSDLSEIEINYDCEYGVVDINANQLGIVVGEEDGDVDYTNNKMSLANASVTYSKVVADKDSESAGSDLQTNDKDSAYTVQFTTKIDTNQFSGNIFSVFNESGKRIISAELRDLTYKDNGDTKATKDVEKILINGNAYAVDGIKSYRCIPKWQVPDYEVSDWANYADLSFEYVIIDENHKYENVYRVLPGPYNLYTNNQTYYKSIANPFISTADIIDILENDASGSVGLKTKNLNSGRIIVASNTSGASNNIFIRSASSVLDSDYEMEGKSCLTSASSISDITSRKNTFSNIFYDKDFDQDKNIILDIDGDEITDVGSGDNIVVGKICINGSVVSTEYLANTGSASSTLVYSGFDMDSQVNILEGVEDGQIHNSRKSYNNVDLAFNLQMSSDFSIMNDTPVQKIITES